MDGSKIAPYHKPHHQGTASIPLLHTLADKIQTLVMLSMRHINFVYGQYYHKF